MDDSLVFLPLGGTGEIGMNCNLYGFGSGKKRHWLMVDLGITFPRLEAPGIDVITPDISFIASQKKQLCGLVLTHGHEDHIGAVPHLWPALQCPIYTTPFTAELVYGKLVEAGLEERAEIRLIPEAGQLDIGPFHLDFIHLTHSIAEMQAVKISCGDHKVLHTGDWKIDPDPVIGKASSLDALQAAGDEGIDAIICDSTNVLTSGRSGSEKHVAGELAAAVAAQTGRVVVTTFASNVARLASIGAAARACDRHVTLAGLGMRKIFRAAVATGYLNDFPPVIDDTEAGYLPPEKLLILCTGSQGEPRAALSRLAEGSHPHLTIEAGDTAIFSSKMIPGNETEILDLQNRLAKRGIKVLTAGAGDIHVSGHPCREELEDMYRLVRPRISIPVHGEARHLIAHAELAQSLGTEQALVIENGDMVQLAPGKARVIDRVPVGRFYLDGQVLVQNAKEVLAQRRKLAYVGVVSVALAVDKAGRLCAEPEITTSGLPECDSEGIKLSDWIREAVEMSLPDNGRVTRDIVTAEMPQKIGRILKQNWGKKPVVHVMLVKV